MSHLMPHRPKKLMLTRPSCALSGCCAPAMHSCPICDVHFYCSKEHRHQDYQGHRATQCYRWDPPNTDGLEQWDVEAMLIGPTQESDPPEEFDHLNQQWKDREFTLGGIVLFKASLLQSDIKNLIKEGLKKRRLTWEYISKFNMLSTIVSATMPVVDVLSVVQELIDAKLKPNATAKLECVQEHFWRIRRQPIHRQTYRFEIGRILFENDLALPFTSGSGYHCKELRQFTHPPTCDCFACQSAPHEAALYWETYERVRYLELARGQTMVSAIEYQEKLLHEAERVKDGHLWRQGEDGRWKFIPEENRTVRCNFSREEKAKMKAMYDDIQKQKRAPMRAELDALGGIIYQPLPRDARGDGGGKSDPSEKSAARPSQASADASADADVKDVGEDVSPDTPLESESRSKKSHKKNKHNNRNKNNQRNKGAARPGVHEENDNRGEGGGSDQATTLTIESDEGSHRQDAHDEDQAARFAALCNIDPPRPRPRRKAVESLKSYVELSSEEEGGDDGDGVKDRGRSKSTKASKPVFSDNDDDDDASDWSGQSGPGRPQQRTGDDEDSDDDSSLALSSEGSLTSTSVSDGQTKRRQRSGKSRGDADKARSSTSPRGRGSSGGSKVYWTDAMDDLLRKAVARCGEGKWVDVAAFINEAMEGGVKVDRAMVTNRWFHTVNPKLSKFKGLDVSWTKEEEVRVRQYGEEAQARGGKIDWKGLEEELDRSSRHCALKWKNMQTAKQNASLKTGPFTKEEDAMIRKMVVEWGGKQGQWKAIGGALGRPSNSVHSRFMKSLNKT